MEQSVGVFGQIIGGIQQMDANGATQKAAQDQIQAQQKAEQDLLNQSAQEKQDQANREASIQGRDLEEQALDAKKSTSAGGSTGTLFTGPLGLPTPTASNKSTLLGV